MSLHIQYISDIHLEFCDYFNIISHAPNLALCGDIGLPETQAYQDFILQVSRKFKNVFVIFGNHEYYNKYNFKLTMSQKKKYTLFFPENVYFLEQNYVYLDVNTNQVYKTCKENCVKIIGSTLWTNISIESSLKMNDYRFIYTKKDTLIKRKDVIQLYNKSKNYIIKEIKKEPHIKCILLTHHGTHPIFFGKNRNDDVMSAYVNDIPELYVQTNLIACISGHSHYSISEKISFGRHSIYFLSNQYGYPYENNNLTKFENNKVFNYHVD
jgi:hypothetical protein